MLPTKQGAASMILPEHKSAILKALAKVRRQHRRAEAKQVRNKPTPGDRHNTRRKNRK